MNIIVDKLNLPCDMKREICKYCYDELGYTIEDLNAIKKEKNKKRNKFMKLRQKLELSKWWMSGSLIHALCTRLHKEHIYAGGRLKESKLFRSYNSHRRIGDPDNDFIDKLLEEGDSRREYHLKPNWPGSEWNPETRRCNNYHWNRRRWIYQPNF